MFSGLIQIPYMVQGSSSWLSPYLFTFDLFVRHLAEKWATNYILPHQSRRLMDFQMTGLDGIEHLILLDLLGAPRPVIRSHFLDTAWLFDAIVSAERRLGDSGAFVYGDNASMGPGRWNSFFRPRTTSTMNFDGIGDDHVPFLARGVSVVHLIPDPFPMVWHRLAVCLIPPILWSSSD